MEIDTCKQMKSTHSDRYVYIYIYRDFANETTDFRLLSCLTMSCKYMNMIEYVYPNIEVTKERATCTKTIFIHWM